MARTTVVLDSILPRHEAFLVDAPTPQASPRRWIQAKNEFCSHLCLYGTKWKCSRLVTHQASAADVDSH